MEVENKQNPYESTQAACAPRRTRSTRWLVWAGVFCIAIALICIALTVWGMIYSFNVIATSNAPRPEELARGIGISSRFSLAAVPFGILGAILLIAGFAIRRPMP
jgi:hypothetical protein